MPSPDTACVRAPASKSISHRYCIGAALAHGTSELHHVLDSRDLECTRAILCAAGALGSRPVRVDGLRADSLQGDRAMLDILRAMGARAEVEGTSITVHPSALHGVDVDMGHCPDLVPTVAVLAAFAQGPTRVRNVAHLRIKESDRITAPATELARLGVRVDEHDDGLTVHGTGPDGPIWDEAARFSAHNDHRIAMSLALLGLPHGKRMDALLDDPLVVRKSFPTFWKVWERLL